jgi:predicted CopG family antitoxin|tara:strand:- start:251 stop:406 length:156 start_codon:yes stop_codon:yes gene_type:complete
MKHDNKSFEDILKGLTESDKNRGYSIFDRWQMDQVERDEIRRLTANEARKR